MTNKMCPTCQALLPADARFCGECGTRVDVPNRPAGGAPPVQQAPPAQPTPVGPPFAAAGAPPGSSYQQPQYYAQSPPTAVYAVSPQPSSTFAVVTLLFYIFVFPIGALLNLIGLLTGPRRGCFAAMFLFILVPAGALVGLVVAAAASGKLDQWIKEIEDAANSNARPQQEPPAGNELFQGGPNDPHPLDTIPQGSNPGLNTESTPYPFPPEERPPNGYPSEPSPFDAPAPGGEGSIDLELPPSAVPGAEGEREIIIDDP